MDLFFLLYIHLHLMIVNGFNSFYVIFIHYIVCFIVSEVHLASITNGTTKDVQFSNNGGTVNGGLNITGRSPAWLNSSVRLSVKTVKAIKDG